MLLHLPRPRVKESKIIDRELLTRLQLVLDDKVFAERKAAILGYVV